MNQKKKDLGNPQKYQGMIVFNSIDTNYPSVLQYPICWEWDVTKVDVPLTKHRPRLEWPE